MKIEKFRNPRVTYDDWIECEIEHPTLGWIPFSCPPKYVSGISDTIDTRDLYEKLKENKDLIQFDPPLFSTEESKSESIRRERDQRLRDYVDPLVSNPLRWNSLSAGLQYEWVDYRQALLDVPQQPSFPDHVYWPNKPSYKE